MTFVNDGFVSSSDCFILSTSPSSPSQSSMQPDHAWPSDLWSSYYTPNHCTCIPKPHDPSTFDPSCIWTLSPAELTPTEQLKHVYPSPPATDSDPKHTVPLPVLCDDSPSHGAGKFLCSLPSTLPPSSPSTSLAPHSESPLTSHPSTQHLPLSPPPSLPMVPHPLPGALRITDARTDTGLDLDLDLEVPTSEPVTDGDSQSSSSPDESSSTDLLTPLSPIWDFPPDDADARPAGTLEVSTLMSRSLVSPLVRYGSLGVQAMEGDRMTLSSGSYSSIRDLDPKIESHCGQLCSLVVPPDGRVGSRFTMIHTLFPTSNGLSSDGSLGHSQFSSGGKPSVDSHTFNLLLSHTDIPHTLPHLVLPCPRLRPRLLLQGLNDPTVDTRRRDSYDFLDPCHDVDPRLTSSASLSVPPGTGIVPVYHPGGMETGAVSSELFHGVSLTKDDAMLPSPLSEFGGPSFCTIGTEANSHSGSTDLWGFGAMDYTDTLNSTPFGLESDLVPSSPMRSTFGELHADDEDFFESSPLPQSPSRRSFSELPEDTAMNGLSPSPPQSPLLAGQPLLTLPGAEPDNSLIVSEPPVSEWSAPSSPRGSGLGLFLPIQAASSNQPETSETHTVEPNLNFSTEAIARVDAFEFEKLKSVRRRTWVSERKAKEDEVFHAKRAELLAGRLSVAPPVPSKLADFDERGGVSAGADADGTEGPPGEPAQLDESDEKTIRSWLVYTEARRAEARRVRKREKERGRELQALLRLKLGEDPDVTERATGAATKIKPGKTAIVSMPQLVARMIMKRRDTPRPFSPRRHDSPYICSPLSRPELEPAVDDYVMEE
ncbi:hypothetical protein EDB85DRAFT_1163821 [Lactarius pseudohatsudake]|nr:hypothetical protein EDB85DRAFT_1163821 [Lactarius pseudohatsudake]